MSCVEMFLFIVNLVWVNHKYTLKALKINKKSAYTSFCKPHYEYLNKLLNSIKLCEIAIFKNANFHFVRIKLVCSHKSIKFFASHYKWTCTIYSSYIAENLITKQSFLENLSYNIHRSVQTSDSAHSLSRTVYRLFCLATFKLFLLQYYVSCRTRGQVDNESKYKSDITIRQKKRLLFSFKFCHRH